MQGKLFGLGGRGRHLFSPQGLELLMNVEHPLQRQVLAQETQLAPPFGGLLLGDEIVRGPGLGWAPYMSRSQDRRSRCTHSFSITGGRWL